MAAPGNPMHELIDKVFICTQKTQVDRLLDQLSDVRCPTVLSFINAHAVNLAQKDETFQHHLLASDILLRDGSGMAILFRWFQRSAGINLNGTDFIPRVVDRYRGRSVAILGTKQPWLGRAADRLRWMGADVVEVWDGFQSVSFYREILKKRGADLVILGMGMPKQEAIAFDLRHHLERPCLIVNGGAILDFMAGRFPRAPKLFQRLGMEWSYRLWKEPRRLFRRYIIGNCVFLYSVIRLARAPRGRA